MLKVLETGHRRRACIEVSAAVALVGILWHSVYWDLGSELPGVQSVAAVCILFIERKLCPVENYISRHLLHLKVANEVSRTEVVELLGKFCLSVALLL